MIGFYTAGASPRLVSVSAECWQTSRQEALHNFRSPQFPTGFGVLGFPQAQNLDKMEKSFYL